MYKVDLKVTKFHAFKKIQKEDTKKWKSSAQKSSGLYLLL